MSKPLPKWSFGAATDVGVRRRGRPNEDAIGIDQSYLAARLPLAIVADGMGGYQGGAQASEIVVATFRQAYHKMPSGLHVPDLLNRLVQAAHAEIIRTAARDKTLASMGSTVAAVLFGPDRIGVINVGDSRAYLIREGQLRQMSTDQSRRAELEQAGMPEEAVRDHPERSYLTMSLSPQRREVLAKITEEPVREGDCVLLCSDGLWNTLSPIELVTVITDLDPQPAADKLIQLANTSQAADNVSAIVARLGQRPARPVQLD